MGRRMSIGCAQRGCRRLRPDQDQEPCVRRRSAASESCHGPGVTFRRNRLTSDFLVLRGAEGGPLRHRYFCCINPVRSASDRRAGPRPLDVLVDRGAIVGPSGPVAGPSRHEPARSGYSRTAMASLVTVFSAPFTSAERCLQGRHLPGARQSFQRNSFCSDQRRTALSRNPKMPIKNAPNSITSTRKT